MTGGLYGEVATPDTATTSISTASYTQTYSSSSSSSSTTDSDVLVGGDGSDRFFGDDGDDTIDGGGGDDSLTGGDGFDTFRISSGDDTIADFGTATGGDANDGDASNNDVIDLSYICGDELTIADISFVCDFAQFLREGHYESQLQEAGLELVSQNGLTTYPNAYTHMLKLSEEPNFSRHFGSYLNWFKKKVEAEQ